MRFDKPIDKVDSIVGIPIFAAKKENKVISNTDQKQENKPMSKQEHTGLKQLKL